MSSDSARFSWIEPSRDAKDYRQVTGLAAPPRDGDGFHQAAERMRRAGHFVAAAEYYERALGFDPHRYEAGAALVDCLVRGGELARADRKSHELLDAFRQVRPYYAARAVVLAHRGDAEQALPLAAVAIEGEPSWYGHCAQAEVLLKWDLSYRQDALNEIGKGIDAAPTSWDPYFVGGCIVLEHWPALAVGYFAEAAHCDPSVPVSWLCLGDCFFALRLHDQALFYYQTVLDLEATHEVALERQRRCQRASLKMMRFFRPDKLRERWEKHIEKLRKEWEQPPDEF